MSAPRYPAHGGSAKLKGFPGECRACAQPATHTVRIQNDNMRSEDDVFRVCGRHESIARQGDQGVKRLLSHIETKGRFLTDPDTLKDEARKRRENDR